MKLSTAEINSSMVEALKGVNNVMEKVNATMDIHGIQQILKEFAKNSEKMEMQQEMMSDAIDDGMDNVEDVDAADKIYAQICDEIGVELAEENDVPQMKVNNGTSQAVSQIQYSFLNEGLDNFWYKEMPALRDNRIIDLNLKLV